MVKAKRPPRTIKEKKFVKEYLKTGNATEAAAKVYDVSNRASAGAIGGENLQKLTISQILDNAGLTDEKIGKTLNEAIEANKPIGAINSKDADSSTMDFIDVPDWQARLKATELASKIKGHLKDRIVGDPNEPLHVNHTFTDDQLERILSKRAETKDNTND